MEYHIYNREAESIPREKPRELQSRRLRDMVKRT